MITNQAIPSEPLDRQFWDLLCEYEIDVINSCSALKPEELEHDLRIYIQMLVNLYRQNSIVKVTMNPDPGNFEFETDAGWSRTYAIQLRFSSTENDNQFFPTNWVRSAVASLSMEWGYAFRIR
jgi:hypothetical protein